MSVAERVMVQTLVETVDSSSIACDTTSGLGCGGEPGGGGGGMLTSGGGTSEFSIYLRDKKS